MKVLVTGCKGQVGTYLEKQLKNKAELIAVGREELDITNETAVINLVTNIQPDFIINAAAYTAVDKAEVERELAYKVNRDGALFLAKAAELVNAVILHLSTDYVFDGALNRSYIETDEPSPNNIYGASKLAGEKAIIQNCSKYVILRTAWVFGEYGSNFVKTMLRLAGEKEKLSIVGDQYGGPTFAGDIASALISIAEKIKNSNDIHYGVYHYSGMPYVNWYDFAVEIFKSAIERQEFDRTPILNSIPTKDYPTPAKRPVNSCLNCKKIETQFGIKPSNWQQALNNIQVYV
ncbi:dTDP-4-dehydrorhamnose reductase [Endozoicomonas sp. SM1973]|uniref:dTDP-4-dehydrorhamnose reductase n=1 Tax=Spartinivicinus marinus TaxID=2994442 RepID=A0A853I6K3_9GAMM|nr:dTDP-4-dehydrorhamnose reductase [Spartinivicinus marinus]MCX4028846.1 dTDP-4-dehydrorhamnose reductase [Spartinivicinus marinus]NYZ65571.1 dTDP-4-dehydrorhamnose reductase [Spartinivicinus marinus]